MRELVEHGQAAIATAQEKGDEGSEEDPVSGLMGMLKTMLPGVRVGVGVRDSEEDDDDVGQCPSERVMGIIMTLARNDWKIDIQTNDEEECWVVSAQHAQHGLTENKHPELFTALAQTGAELRQFLKQADA